MSILVQGNDRDLYYDNVDQIPVGLVSKSGHRNPTGMFPCIGKYWTPKGQKPAVAFMLVHYAADFSDHYLAGPLSLRGFGVLGYATRFRGMEERFILEHALDDIAAGTEWLKKHAGVKKIVFIGNSGGGSLMAALQARVEQDSATVGADAYIFLNAHPGRADVLTDVLDPSVIDESDPTKTDASLDMYNPVNGPPYSEDFQTRYRAAQKQRNYRITKWAKEELKKLNAAGIKDRMFSVDRTWADLRFMDPNIDQSKRPSEICYFGHPKDANFDVGLLARACTLTTWLSMWSLEDSKSRFPLQAATFTLPTLVLQSWSDMGVFPSYARSIYDSCGSKNKELRFIEGAHFFEDSEEHLDSCADIIAEWVRKTLQEAST